MMAVENFQSARPGPLRKSLIIPDSGKSKMAATATGKKQRTGKIRELDATSRLVPVSYSSIKFNERERNRTNLDSPSAMTVPVDPWKMDQICATDLLTENRPDQQRGKFPNGLNISLPVPRAGDNRKRYNLVTIPEKATISNTAVSFNNNRARNTELADLIVEGKSPKADDVIPQKPVLFSRYCIVAKVSGVLESTQSPYPNAVHVMRPHDKATSPLDSDMIRKTSPSPISMDKNPERELLSEKVQRSIEKISNNVVNRNLSKIPKRSLHLEGISLVKTTTSDLGSYVASEKEIIVSKAGRSVLSREIEKMRSMKKTMKTISSFLKTRKSVAQTRTENAEAKNGNADDKDQKKNSSPDQPHSKITKRKNKVVPKHPTMPSKGDAVVRKIVKKRSDTSAKSRTTPNSKTKDGEVEDKSYREKQTVSRQNDRLRGRKVTSTVQARVFSRVKPAKQSLPEQLPDTGAKPKTSSFLSKTNGTSPSAVDECAENILKLSTETSDKTVPKAGDAPTEMEKESTTSSIHRCGTKEDLLKEILGVLPHLDNKPMDVFQSVEVENILQQPDMDKPETVSESLPHQLTGEPFLMDKKVQEGHPTPPKNINGLSRAEGTPDGQVKRNKLTRSQSVDGFRVGSTRKSRRKKIINSPIMNTGHAAGAAGQALRFDHRKTSLHVGRPEITKEKSHERTSSLGVQKKKVSYTGRNPSKSKTGPTEKSKKSPFGDSGSKRNVSSLPKPLDAPLTHGKKTKVPEKKVSQENRKKPRMKKKKKSGGGSNLKNTSSSRSKTSKPLKKLRKGPLFPFSPGEVNSEKAKQFRHQFMLFSKFGDRRNTGQAISMNNTIRWLKQAVVIRGRKVTTNDVEIFFIHATQRRRSLSMVEFVNFLKTLVKEKNLTFTSVTDSLINCGEPTYSQTDIAIETLTKTEDGKQGVPNPFAKPLFPPNVEHSTQTVYRKSSKGRQLRKMMRTRKVTTALDKLPSDMSSLSELTSTPTPIPFPIPPSYMMSPTDLSTYSSTATSRCKLAIPEVSKKSKVKPARRSSESSDTSQSGKNTPKFPRRIRIRGSKPRATKSPARVDKSSGTPPKPRVRFQAKKPSANRRKPRAVETRPKSRGGPTAKKALRPLHKAASDNFVKAESASTISALKHRMSKPTDKTSLDDSYRSPANLPRLDPLGFSTGKKSGDSREIGSVDHGNDGGPILIPKCVYARSSDIETSGSSGEFISATRKESEHMVAIE